MRGQSITWVRRLCVAMALAVTAVTIVVGSIGGPPVRLPRARTARPAVLAQSAIAVVGDSVAYGAYDSVRGGWVTRLGGMLAASYPHAHLRIMSFASNGGNTAILMPVLRRLEHQVRPVLVIIAFGLNDFDEGVSRAALASHLRAALRLLRTWPRPPAVVLMGLPPITALSPARLRVERAYTDTIRRMALAEHAGYLDQLDLWLALGNLLMHRLRHDTEHPNAFGYAFTAASVAAFLEGAYLDGRGDIRPPRTPPTCAATLCGS